MEQGVTSICAGFDHTCAVVNGSALCVGGNSHGELGLGSVGGLRRVAAVAIASNVKEVACGYLHACALTTDSRIKCWGMNDQGQLGNSTNDASPVPVDVTWP
jgi:alpha-tubulin suppressor-like RCC1 family protein